VIEFTQIRKMSDRELEDALKQAKQDLWGARFALSTRQLSDTSTIPQHRRTIARILTVQRERQTAMAAALAAPAERTK
jgi:large subunit ribosomal protein L29